MKQKLKLTKKLKNFSKLSKLSKKKLKKKTKKIMKGGTVNEYLVECINNIKGHKCSVNKKTTLSKAIPIISKAIPIISNLADNAKLALNLFIKEDLPGINKQITENIVHIFNIKEYIESLSNPAEIQPQIKEIKSYYENLLFLYNFIFSQMTSISKTSPEMSDLKDKEKSINKIKKILLDLEEKYKIEKPTPIISKAKATSTSADDTEILNNLTKNIKFSKIQVRLKPHCGISNKGNTCYLNSVIQLLYSIPQVKYLFTTISLQRITELKINVGDPSILPTSDKNNKLVLKGLREIFLLMNEVIEDKTKNNIEKVLNNQDQVNAINKLLSKTKERIGTQRDAQEFIGEIFACFVDYSNESLIKYLYNLFNFNFLFQNICKNGDPARNNKLEDSSILTIPINGKKLRDEKIEITLKNLIDLYLKKEELEESEYFGTDEDNCGPLQFVLNADGTRKEFKNTTGKIYEVKYNKISRQILVKIPENQKYLIVLLKRFEFNPRTGGVDLNQKITTAIPFEKDLTIDGITFRIYGIIRHKGGTKGGHYLYELFDEEGNRYKTLNDSQVSKPSGTIEELRSDAYVFLYRRI